ncbi:HalOD1 output domain-containing protein [Halomarina rubra]|uniref:HalOD1 output domain-containing protein n=1 Tax=Halomarina rubra TaxID=2071873 RepID=A0ABD6B0N7_9EURY|nr:HalOD1 output domain-containing protein [Halomarina rubra]
MSTIPSPNDAAELASSATYDHRAIHETDADRSLSVTVVTAVGEALDADPTAVAPLYHSIDPDALDTLFAPADDASMARLMFEHEGCSVDVRGDGEVLVSVLSD